jgi:hypothetical protein
MNGFWGDGGPYETWVAALRAWQKGEPADLTTLPALEREQFTADTWARLTGHILHAVSVRLTDCVGRFGKAIGEASDEFSVGRELTHARAGLRAVRALASHPGLPTDVRDTATRLCDEQIRSLQEQLEHAVTREARNGGSAARLDLRLRTLRDNALTAAIVPLPQPPARPVRFAGLRHKLRRGRAGPGQARAVENAPDSPAADPWATDGDRAGRRRIMPD